MVVVFLGAAFFLPDDDGVFFFGAAARFFLPDDDGVFFFGAAARIFLLDDDGVFFFFFDELLFIILVGQRAFPSTFRSPVQ